MKYKSLILTLLFITFGQLFAQDVEHLITELDKVQGEFQKTLNENPTNKGAKLLLDEIAKLKNAMNQFADNKIQSDSVQTLLQATYLEASKYETDKAQRLAKILNELNTAFRLASKTSNTDTTADNAYSENHTPHNNKLDEENTKLLLQNSKDIDSLQKLIYILTGIIVVILGIGGYFLFTLNKQEIKTVQNKLESLEQKHLRTSSQHNAGAKSAAAFADDFRERLEKQNNSIAEFLSSNEKKIIDAHAIAKTALNNNEQMTQTLNSLQAQLKELERIFHQPLSPSAQKPIQLESPPQTKPINSPEAQDAIKHLIQIVLLMNPLSTSNPFKALCIKFHETLLKLTDPEQYNTPIEADLVGQFAQLAYVEALNKNLAKEYTTLSDSLELLGFDIEDKMIGRMCFSDFNAENVPYEDYLEEARMRAPSLPGFAMVRQTIQNSKINDNAMKHTVLYVLKPTVFAYQAGVKSLIAKGIYIIKN